VNAVSTPSNPAPEWLPQAPETPPQPAEDSAPTEGWWLGGAATTPADGATWWVGEQAPAAPAPEAAPTPPAVPALEYADAAITDALPKVAPAPLPVPPPPDLAAITPQPPPPPPTPVPTAAPPAPPAAPVPPAALAAAGALVGLLVLVGAFAAWILLAPRPAAKKTDTSVVRNDQGGGGVPNGSPGESGRRERKVPDAGGGLVLPRETERPKPEIVVSDPPAKGPEKEPVTIVRSDPPEKDPQTPLGPPKKEEPRADPPVTDPRVEAPKPDPEKPAPPARLVVKQRRRHSEDELNRAVLRAEEVALDLNVQRNESLKMVQMGKVAAAQGKPFDGTPLLIKQRPDLSGLPLRLGEACKLTPVAADHLQGGSVSLRQHLAQVTNGGGLVRGDNPADVRPDPKRLHDALTRDGERHNKWLKPEAIPALQQLLMAENESVRLVLVDQVALIPGPQASAALAQRVLFDLNPEVRQAALEALRNRPRDGYRQVLLDGLVYPWSVVADHAAEALVALDMRDAVPGLVRLLDAPDPTLPYDKPGSGLVIREVVRVNHLRNCLMCHPPSFSETDKVRGRVPPSNQPLQPFSQGYGGNQNDVFVRADVTYLRQDFSVQLQVANPGLWPEVQRFDFMVRERPARQTELPAKLAQGEARPPSEHQKALFFALRELTGADPGPAAEDWKRLFLRTSAPTRLRDGLKGSGGIAADAKGVVYVADAGRAVLLRIDGSEVKELRKDEAFDGLTVDGKGRLIGCREGRVVALDPDGVGETVLADSFRTPNLRAPSYAAADRQGGLYLSVREAADGKTPGAVYYLSAQGTLTHLPVTLKKPRGLAVAPDGKTLYVAVAESLEVWAFTLESAGNPVKGRVLCKLEAAKGDPVVGGAGVAVDPRGNVFLAHPARRAVQVVNPEGARLGLVSLPEAPLHVTLGGDGGRQLFVSSAEGVYAAELTVGAGLAAPER
jgi:sugar lactone lactonase YvrE